LIELFLKLIEFVIFSIELLFNLIVLSLQLLVSFLKFCILCLNHIQLSSELLDFALEVAPFGCMLGLDLCDLFLQTLLVLVETSDVQFLSF